jgi:hypothetical protein
VVRSTLVLERRTSKSVRARNIGRMEWWKDGGMKHWNVGMMEYWNGGRMGGGYRVQGTGHDPQGSQVDSSCRNPMSTISLPPLDFVSPLRSSGESPGCS